MFFAYIEQNLNNNKNDSHKQANVSVFMCHHLFFNSIHKFSISWSLELNALKGFFQTVLWFNFSLEEQKSIQKVTLKLVIKTVRGCSFENRSFKNSSKTG